MKKYLPIPPIEGEDAKRFVEELLRERMPEEIEATKEILRKAIEVYEKHGDPSIEIV